MHDYVKESLDEASAALTNFLNNREQIKKIYQSIDLLVSSIRAGGRIYSCGNGGSMCDAMHFAEELTGRYRKNRSPIPGIAISDISHATCVANDFGYTEVFSRYIEAVATQDDVVVAISTSGSSKNILSVLKKCKEKNIKTILLTGRENSICQDFASITIVAEGGEFADRTQELHIKILHIFIEGIERNLFPENY